MREWADANQQAIDRLEKERRLQLIETLKSRKELQDLQARLARGTGSDDRPSAWVLDRVQRLIAWVELSERELGDIDALRTERNRLKEELGARVSSFSWRDAVSSARENLIGGWNYEVFSVQDEPIRVKTILTVILLVALGHWVSRKASDAIGRTVFHRMGMNMGRRAAWQTLSFYALFLVVLLAAFNLFHLSLTQFSVVSGALAVGIGFGSQNLIGNFISGIILLIERPVNQGDVIEIDGQQVTVERLGPRSTIVRSFDNTHMIVPNSRLLEQPVTNLTLSDDIVRNRIRVGVAYGSPTREVEKIMHDVLLGLDLVRREPAPQIKFQDFGESALVFDALFWSSIAERREVESELRHRIAEAFDRNGIVMAFPQRDVHLNTTTPLRVQMTHEPPVPAPTAVDGRVIDR
jgi:small-conductance mechanosensitive channel